MSTRTAWVGIVLTALTGPLVMTPAQSHHSFPATYDTKETVTIEGTVTAFLFRNPHSFVHLEIADKDGAKVVYGIEWGGGAALSGQGVQRDTIKRGDHVVIKGNPARDSSSHRVLMRSIVRPKDGWKWEGTFQ